MTNSPTQLQRVVDQEADSLRRNLHRVANQALGAIKRMDEGQMPSPYGDATVFNHDLERAVQAAARLDALVALLHSAEDVEALQKSLKGEGLY